MSRVCLNTPKQNDDGIHEDALVAPPPSPLGLSSYGPSFTDTPANQRTVAFSRTYSDASIQHVQGNVGDQHSTLSASTLATTCSSTTSFDVPE
jgi:hypothetical protein